MASKSGMIDPVGSDDNKTRNNAMQMWQDSIARAREKRETVEKQSPMEQQQELRRKIHSGEMECPTCKARTYQDESGDGSVSFQAARHVSPITAGLAVTSHESEHVANEKAEARKTGGEVVSSSVKVFQGKCPECGRTYVKGGLTTVQKRVSSKLPDSRLNIEV